MKKFTLLYTLILFATGMALAAPQHRGHSGQGAPKSEAKRKAPLNSRKARESTVAGVISDSHCGLKHMEGMSDEKACTLMCVKGGGKFVLADRTRNVVYNLNNDGQEKARQFAGQRVRVTGYVTGRTIHVTKIEAFS